MLDCAELLELAEKQAEIRAGNMFPDKESSEYQSAKARIMHQEYMAMIGPPNRCQHCGK